MHHFLQFVMLLLVCFNVEGQQNDCSKITGNKGEQYDLTPIIGKILETYDNFSYYRVSLCVDSLQCGGCDSAGFCQENNFWKDCIGKFSNASGSIEDGILLSYLGGDWGNTGQVKIKCNPAIDGVSNIKPENYHRNTLCESKYACPVTSNNKLDPGYPFAILFPGYFSTETRVQTGAAVSVASPQALDFKLDVSVKCISTQCAFKVLLVDSANFQLFLVDKPFVCQNDCQQNWGQYYSSHRINNTFPNSNLFVVVIPVNGPADLSILVVAKS